MTSPVSMPAGHEIVATDLDAYENATGVWPSWSPTLANLTLGNGSTSAVYRQVGKTVDYRWQFVLGTTSAVGTDPTFTLPATPHSAYVDANFGGFPVGRVYILDALIGGWEGMAVCFSGNICTPRYNSEIGGGALTGISATGPITFGTADRIMVFGSFEVA